MSDSQIPIITFSGMDRDKKNYMYESHHVNHATLEKEWGAPVPPGLVAILMGSKVNVQDDLEFNWSGIPKITFAKSPSPQKMQHASGVERLEQFLLHINEEGGQPDLFALYLASKPSIDYNLWLDPNMKQRMRSIPFEFDGRQYSFKLVRSIHMAMQGLIDVAIDPGALLHGAYKSEEVMVDLLKQEMGNDVKLGKISYKNALNHVQKAESWLGFLSDALSRFKDEPLSVYIFDSVLHPK